MSDVKQISPSPVAASLPRYRMGIFRRLRNTLGAFSCKGPHNGVAVDVGAAFQEETIVIDWPAASRPLVAPFDERTLAALHHKSQHRASKLLPPLPHNSVQLPDFSSDACVPAVLYQDSLGSDTVSLSAERRLTPSPSTSLETEARFVRAQYQSPVVVSSPSASAIPIEIWWRIIDYFQDDWSALLICTTVCRAWHDQAQKFLAKGCKHAIVLSSRAEVHLLSRCARERVLHTKAVQVHGDDHASLGHLGTFAAMLSGQLQHFNEIQIVGGIWRTDVLHERVLFRCLSTFIGIRHLTLHNVDFPSAMELAGMLAALPNLCFLECVNISTRSNAYDRMLRMHLPPPHPLEYLLLDRVSGFDMHDLFRTMKLHSHVVEVVLPDQDTSESTTFMRKEHVKLGMNLFRNPSMGRFILAIHDKLASYDLLSKPSYW
ncbi:hypothetical protein FOMPIDRAFT_1168788 [Fomitopsis schrenkii]|uniref:F-box domain-containing protein n=1 Tax=Fomitopsis schrenkii TaxID=2126942 RepID=S8DRI8_FOMSC|nr:hypothetical protein FOMPIDRAFT_1168788 [Fomitopsis schrenkii]